VRILTASLACLALAAGASSGAESIHFIGFEGRTSAPTVMPAVFGNSNQSIEIEINGSGALSGTLIADLFQVAGTLAMPLTKNIELQKGVKLSEATRVRITLKLPEALRRMEIVARLALAPDAGAPTRIPLGDLRFDVFPPSTTKEFAGMLQAKDEAFRPEVFGPGHKLRQILSDLRIPFEDGGQGVPDNFDSKRLYLGELTETAQFQQLQDRAPNARILVFAPDDTLPPGIYLDRGGSSALAHLTAPLLENFADDPRAQIALTKILRLLSSPSPNPSGL